MHWDKVSSQIPSVFLSIKVVREWLKRISESIQKNLIWKTIEEHELSMKDSILLLVVLGCGNMNYLTYKNKNELYMRDSNLGCPWMLVDHLDHPRYLILLINCISILL